MCAVVLEILCRAEEVGFPDMVTVMRSLSADSGMPTLPPGGGLASKYVTSKESFQHCVLFHSLATCVLFCYIVQIRVLLMQNRNENAMFFL